MRYLWVLASIILIQCSPKPYIGYQKADQDTKEILPQQVAGSAEDQLAAMLRRESGVIVGQSGSTYTVKIRGLSNSLYGSSSPLFVIDGVPLGDNFNTAAEAISANQIKSVRVLKGQEASIYGSRGSAGVILIKTQKTTLPPTKG